GDPTDRGTVSFDIDGVPYAPAANLPLDGSGQAAFSISGLPVSGSPHTITAIFSDAANVYAPSQAGIQQAVTPAALTIAASSQTTVYGSTLPALTAGYSGFVNGETAASLAPAPTLTTTATAASPVGSYPVT